MGNTIMERAAPQFIREALSRATAEERCVALREVYSLLDAEERETFFAEAARRLVAADERLRSAPAPVCCREP